MAALGRSGEIAQAYRDLYRNGLRAISYSKPARTTLRDQLRVSFRQGRAEHYDATRMRNTVEFLRLAAAVPSLEHRMLRSLLHTWYHDPVLYPRRAPPTRLPAKVPASEAKLQATAREPYRQIVRMLNESMGMCIPV